MASKRKSGTRRKARSTAKRGPWRRRILLGIILVAAAIAAWSWWKLQHWTPPADKFPEQGLVIGRDDAPINLRTAKALGAGFVYLEASVGASGRDPAFDGYFAEAQMIRMRRGAVHMFDPCEVADGQSANFVTMVPRDNELLPPVIALEQTARNCLNPVGEAAVESELMTLINQIEAHAGKPVILRISPSFEDEYGIARRIERNLWLTRTRLEPDYAGRPWLLWTANTALRSEASNEPIRWMVVRP
ncbi:glycoside hydrolase family 25 protein [Altererythrobacter sp. MF3-039]|uniref:glycoside hydrolase family 25 protein n=1 Tax=Altererythrobacter sp. MF3-039 TaxID=3252901 RepID=UPI00390C9A17